MKLFAQAAEIARAGKPEDAVAFIERAAENGDPEGNVLLAYWYLYGTDRPRDFEAAHRHLHRAADTGNFQAIRTLAYLTASGTGCTADPARALRMLEEIAPADPASAEQLALLFAMPADDVILAARRDPLSSDPRVEIVRQLLAPAERAHLMRLAEPALKPSLIDDAVAGTGRPDPIRTSHGAPLLPHDEDLVVQAINRRIARATGTRTDQGEALYVMRYAPGQQYRPHLDALGGLRNPRTMTAIFYLNDDYEGGETVFPELGITLRGEPGDLLVFANVTADGRPDKRLLHAGEPVTSGAKWIATRWIRRDRHDPYDRG